MCTEHVFSRALSHIVTVMRCRMMSQLHSVYVFVYHRDAVGSMDGIQCSFKVMQQLKNLAVSAFGHPSTWTEAQVTDLGNIIGEIISCLFAHCNISKKCQF